LVPDSASEGGIIGTGGIKLSVSGKGDSSGSVAESALPVRLVMTEVRSGCNKKPREKRNSSLLASVIVSSPSATDKEAWDGRREVSVEWEGGLVGRSPCFERFVDLRAIRGALMLTDMCFSRSARSASRSTMMAGACIRRLGILMGTGGPFLIEAVRGGVSSLDNTLGGSFNAAASLELMAEMLITSEIGDSLKLHGRVMEELF